MSYLVTGGAGFIGSHLAEYLLQRGDTVISIDNFNDYYDPLVKYRNIERLSHYGKFTNIDGDIRDKATVNQLFEDHHITHIAHLASMAGVRASVKQVALYMEVNLLGTMNVLEAARDRDLQQFVLASTSSVYGKTENVPFVETDPADRPLASYPASKRAAELLAHTYHNLLDMNVTVLRFFNVYGPNGRPDMMPMRLLNAAQDGTVIPVFNNGDIYRDWTYIHDTVQGVVAALDTPLGYEVMNLGHGSPISLNDFIEIIEEYSGKTINRKPVPTPPSDPPITYCNNEKVKRMLGFAPEVHVRDGLYKTFEWFMTQRNKD